jgi:hypothetical protein
MDVTLIFRLIIIDIDIYTDKNTIDVKTGLVSRHNH